MDIKNMLVGICSGVAVGGLIAAFAKRHYDKIAYEEINDVDRQWRAKTSTLKDNLELATREIYELREACRILLDEGPRETIFEQVKYKMDEFNKFHTESRDAIERMVAVHSLKDDSKVKRASMAEDLAVQLGYAPIEAAEPYSAKAIDPSELEHPMDEEDEYEDELDDDAEPWTTDAGIYVSGDDVTHDSPYVISEWQFTYGRKEYIKESVEYYALDDTVVDTDGDELDQAYIGAENLRAFETDEYPSIFIRNDQLGIDYEIMWVEGSYIHDILGRPESDVYGRRIWRSWEKE